MLSFESPWLFLLLPAPLILRLLLPAFRDVRPAVRIPFFRLVSNATDSTPGSGAVIRKRRWTQASLFALYWIGGVGALARPVWMQPPVTRDLPTRDLLLAIDFSGSMETEDFTDASGERVDRLTAVKEVLDGFLQRRDGDRVGMIVFGSAAFVQVPFTQDLDACRQLVDQVSVRMAGPKTAFGDAIGLGITLFERAELENKVMIALTDGNDTGSKIPPVEAAKIAADQGIVIHTVAVGDPEAAGEQQLDEEALRGVSEATGGLYFFAGDRVQLEEIYVELDRQEGREVETISHRPRIELFHWPLGVLLLLSFAQQALSMLFRARSRAHGGDTLQPEDEEAAA